MSDRVASLGVDVGGTFTDLAWWDGEVLRTAKTPSTPDQSVGVIGGATELLDGATVGQFRHGTTVATNALLERRGARVVYVTTEGFGDVIEIARQDRPSLYDSLSDRTAPLVDRVGRVEVARVEHADEWSAEELERLASAVEALNPDAVAISLLYGFANPDQERRLAGAISGSAVSISSEVVPEFREYERASTTIVNAFLTPETAAYLNHLLAAVGASGLPEEVAVMRSSGGLIPIDQAARLPASILLSGPAGGVVASAALGAALGRNHLISFDMGGTSTDVCRIDNGVPETSYERVIEGLAIRMPSVAIHTVGAGGGSLGWVDAGQALRVGPRSAGANPGPASYRRGGLVPAVTDANLWLGRLGATNRLAGTLELDVDAAEAALDLLGSKLGLDGTATALGMAEIVEAHMERAVRRVSVEEGSDPRMATLVAFGGAGGLHATALARRLEMNGVIVPPFAGVFSAFGLLLAPPRVDLALSQTINITNRETLPARLASLREEATDRFNSEAGLAPQHVRLVADVRYVGQAHETAVDVSESLPWDSLAERFHAAHHQRNGFARPDDPIEVVTLRAVATGTPAMEWSDLAPMGPGGGGRRGVRQVLGPDGRSHDTEIWWRPDLSPGTEVLGPAVIEEREATTFVAGDERMTVHPSGAMELEW